MHDALAQLGSVDVLMIYERAGSGFRIKRTLPLVVEGCWDSGWLRLRRSLHRRRVNGMIADKVDFRNYDVICGRHLWPISGLTLPREVPTIVDVDDLHYSYPSAGNMFTSTARRVKTSLGGALDTSAMRRFSAFWFVSDRDRQRCPSFPGLVLPNIPTFPKVAPRAQATEMIVLFVGALWYEPNRLGVEWFLRSCWPRIRQAEPNARFRIVGEGPAADRTRWSTTPGVEAPGFVDDLSAAYSEAALTVAPIFSGGGSNIKVLESLAYRRACIATTFSLQAFVPHLRAGEHLFVADSEHAMVDSCLSLLRDRNARASLADAGKAAVDRFFSPEAFRGAVHELVAQIPVDRQPHRVGASARPSIGPARGTRRA
jgi:glycosyltransferase involved in cell wall biosynthesis